MAYFKASGGAGTIYWEAELSQPFVKDRYLQMGLCREEFENGGTVPPEGIFYPVAEAKSTPMYGDVGSDDSKYVTGQIDNLSSGKYIVYCFAQTSNGQYWYVPEFSSPEDNPIYYAEVIVSSSGGGDSGSIELWDWNKNSSRRTAYKILIGELPVSAGFSASVWNAIVDKAYDALTSPVNGARRWGDSDDAWMPSHLANSLPVDRCKVKAGDTLSSAIYNSVLMNIDVFSSSPHPNMQLTDGGELTGAHIIYMTDNLNHLINWLNN